MKAAVATRMPAGALALVACAFVLSLGAAAPARAALFSDDEARRAILELRQKFEASDQARARLAEQTTQLNEQIAQLKRSLFELNSSIEAQRGDNARLRGQMEELARTVAELQRKQLDIQQGVDDRIRKIEPQKVTIEDKEVLVDPEEKRQYDDALASFRRGEFDRASSGFGALLRRFPATGYRDSALFWMGNAQYGRREYKDAIVSFRSLVAASPQGPRAPEAMLAIANCQAELKDVKGARKTIDDLLKTYPKSEAAVAGKERLASLR